MDFIVTEIIKMSNITKCLFAVVLTQQTCLPHSCRKGFWNLSIY